ncbi:HAD-IIB family hydrolase [Desulfospira joergensenii]|uniref:HAD-IIB family hydrolase n=1 Tax=Desulfospira joergensenii TaxID=53329 RepID=UPI0003B420E0|nr:HAD-IIB family hydrolase [Desulfospira joergensenii]
MKPLEQLEPGQIKKIDAVFFDIDDTFSFQGKILPQAYGALWNLKDAGIRLVPITGRPAGWCDHIARMWPVDGVVGENGAFFFWCDQKTGGVKNYFYDPPQVRTQKRERLELIKEEILESIPGAGIASDQNYRESDLAVDFCEDVAPLDKDQIHKICRIFEKHGATYKVSSIHVNGWFGDYSKIDMTKTMVSHLWKIDLDNEKDRYVFCGDSPNDEPMFEFFPISIGVNNVLNFEDQLEVKPGFVTKGEGGVGFAQIAEHILKHR